MVGPEDRNAGDTIQIMFKSDHIKLFDVSHEIC